MEERQGVCWKIQANSSHLLPAFVRRTTASHSYPQVATVVYQCSTELSATTINIINLESLAAVFFNGDTFIPCATLKIPTWRALTRG
ncbi:uncharacterized protein LOC118471071 isoform X3 [Amphiprion ocellaris]|uniref:uncharacterized protein LOC118471071 isoform X3 n=1 Tax=Amphiprion ocellaris TaxID=80972 RepID=UPI002410C470|nr:uncharacterized protein LOC118471071 isoform X3 [Amphiprion ocellaris]